MDTWPEFVTDAESETPRAAARTELTGWETVIFQVGDAQDDGGSDFSPAAIAP